MPDVYHFKDPTRNADILELGTLLCLKLDWWDVNILCFLFAKYLLENVNKERGVFLHIAMLKHLASGFVFMPFCTAGSSLQSNLDFSFPSLNVQKVTFIFLLGS